MPAPGPTYQHMSLREWYIGQALAGIEARECKDARHPSGDIPPLNNCAYRADLAIETADYIMVKLGYV